MTELTLEGDRYTGRFLGRIETYEKSVGSEYTRHLADFNRWSGEGVIEDTQTGEKQKFIFFTQESSRKTLGTLEEEMIRIKHKYNEIEPQIVKPKPINDILLRQMYADSQRLEEEQIIPHISPDALPYEDLLDKGFIAEESGQIRLPLGAA